jgi:membrane protease YdiL (CAAX protease family)
VAWTTAIRFLPLGVTIAACVTPLPPVPPHPPAPDRYDRAADPDPAARAAAADELAFDPAPAATRMLVVLLGRDVDPAVRARAAAAIQHRRDTSLASAVEVAAARDPDPTVRTTALAAHRRLAAWSKRPGTAAGLSLLCPGCGQFYLGNSLEGAAVLGSAVALIGGAVALTSGHGISIDGTSDSAKVPIGIAMIFAAQNLWFYSIFDAYRDARVLRGDEGYRFKITRESLPKLASAPFDPRVLASPWVWAGVPIALAAGIGFSYLISRGEFTDHPSIFEVDRVNVLGHDFHRGTGFAAGSAYFAALFTGVGVGEEALFRGVIQTELEERWGPTRGLIAASAIFGAVHLFNFLQDPKTALVAVPVIGVLGSSLGLAYQHTGHRLSTSVAMHFWYDTLLSMTAFAADPTHQPFVVSYSGPMN